MKRMKNNFIILFCLLFSRGDPAISSYRIIKTLTDSRQGTTIENSHYRRYKDKLVIYTRITLPNGAEIKRDQIAEFGSGIQTFIIQYPDGSIKAGYLTQRTIYSSPLKRVTHTKVYVGERLSSETTVATYNLEIGDF